MELWRGPIGEFVRDAQVGALAPAMLQSFYTLHGYQPGPPEVRSWEDSLKAQALAANPLQSSDIGVVVECHLPFSNQRIDAVFLGKGGAAERNAPVSWLQQGTNVIVHDEFCRRG